MSSINDANVIVSTDFLNSMIKLPKADQAAAKAFVTQFKQDKNLPDENVTLVKRTNNAEILAYSFSSLHSVILVKPLTSSSLFLIVWVGENDAAIKWATNHEPSIHPETGSLQLLDITKANPKTEKTVPESTASENITSINSEEYTLAPSDSELEEYLAPPIPPVTQILTDTENKTSIQTPSKVEHQIQSESDQNVSEDKTSPKNKMPAEKQSLLFSDYKENEITALGVPVIFIAKVMALVNEAELISIKDDLPAEAYEALYLLAKSGNYQALLASYNDIADDEEVDTKDFEKALQRKSTQRNFTLITDDEILKKMLDAPLEKWRVFLHPSQKKLVELETRGPIRVLGGAGTGKTIVAMHRAVYLAQKLIKSSQTKTSVEIDKKILLLTFTTILANDIRNNLQKITTEDVLQRIEVINIDAWVNRFLHSHNYNYRLVYEDDAEREDCWKKALTYMPQALTLEASFYNEEWRYIILQHGIKNKEDYFKVNRNGRGTALDREERAKAWAVFKIFRELLEQKKIRDIHDAFHDMLNLVKKEKVVFPYSSIIIDEAQDLSSAAFKLIRQIMPEKDNDLFIIGDGHQRIYRNKVILGRCGINIKGRRSKKLNLNYRTTEEISQFATAIMDDVIADNLDAGTDNTEDYASIMRGKAPEIKIFSNQQEEITYIANTIKVLIASGVATKDICVVVKTRTLRDKYIEILNYKGIETITLDNQAPDNQLEGVRVSTVYRIKGLEFGYVFLAAINEEHFSLNEQITADPVEKRDREFNQRALLHVAATRAIKELHVTCSNKISPLIPEKLLN